MNFTPSAFADLRVSSTAAINDFSDSLIDSIADIESLVGRLNKQPQDIVQLQALYRALSKIKLNAAAYQLISISNFIQPIEDQLSEMRTRKLAYFPLFGELLLLCLDRLQVIAETLLQGTSIDSLQLTEIEQALNELSSSSPEQILLHTINLVEMISGHKVDNQLVHEIIVDLDDYLQDLHIATQPTPVAKPANLMSETIDDLDFFHQLADSLELRNPFWLGRTERNLTLARQTNQLAGSPLDERQLDAAVLMHDVGMAFLPDPVWTKLGKFTETDSSTVQAHVKLGEQLFSRISGWEAAVQMTAQHHERMDGSGYPRGLSGAEICSGARLLAILDAFESMTHERGDRDLRRSILRAVTELNACENQFDREWMGHFNQIVRQLLHRQTPT